MLRDYTSFYRTFSPPHLPKPHLFCLQCELYEDLLQFLVDKVNAELLKAIFLEDLEAVDVQDPNVDFLHRLGHSYIN